jgi:hypothetical protein
MITTRKSVTRTMIPLEWDNMGGYLAWRAYVRQSVMKNTIPTDLLILESQRVLVRESRYTPTPYLITRKPAAIRGQRNDRIVYLVLFIAAVIISLCQ